MSRIVSLLVWWQALPDGCGEMIPMLNQRAHDAVAASRIDDALAVPLYGSYCFDGIPGMVPSVLLGTPPTMPDDVLPDSTRRHRAVVLVLLDGFGWALLQRAMAHTPFFRRFLTDGVASRLTAQFPSTTAAHMTTIHTGLPVGRSGIFEWYYREPTLGRIVAPLPGIIVDGDARLPLPESPGLFPEQTRYAALARAGVRSTCLMSGDYADSLFSRAMTVGADVVPFASLSEALDRLGDGLARSAGPAFHFLYLDTIDHHAHRLGPDDPAIDTLIQQIGRGLEALLPVLARHDALLMLTADHGQTAVSMERLVHLDARLPQLSSWMVRDVRGRPLGLGGGPRDVFLYLQPDAVPEAVAALSEVLAGRARVYRTDDLLAQGLFGPSIGPRLRTRLGNVVILPEPGEMVWWGPLRSKRGHHGGLSAEELEIPLLTLAA